MKELDTISILGNQNILKQHKSAFFISVIKILRLFKTDVLILVGEPPIS